ncbi:monocarboxylate transporter 5-like [Littorina saxatilis]|uniref:monocarboxylate transporter 5-like n=1 Tax=Littorina saxatilis TaxID=31220 RepID=UPI0038B67612
MIVVSSFMISVLVDGVCFSAGIFFNPFRSYFGTTKAQTAWVGSVLNGSYLTAGPLVSACVNRYGCRPVAMFGSVFAAAAFFISTFSPNMPVLIVTYGLLGGLGFGFVYLPAIVMVGYYFEKRRALATGVACCGSGIGAFLFAPLCNTLLEVYGWQGATWILAGLVLNGLVFSIFYRPLEHAKGDLDTVVENGGEAAKVKDDVKVKVNGGESWEQTRALLGGDTADDDYELREMAKDKDAVLSVSVGDHADVSKRAPSPSPANPDAGDTTALATTIATTVSETAPLFTTTITKVAIPTIVLPGEGVEGEEGAKEKNGNAHPNISDLIQTVTPEIHSVQSEESKAFMSDFQLKDSGNPVARMAFSQDVFSHNKVKKRQPHRHRHHLHHDDHHQHHHHHSHNYLEVDNPLQRRDIFYSGSLRHIPEYQSAHSLAEYRQKVTILPCDDSDGEEGEEGDSTGDEESIVSRRRSFFKRIVCDPFLAIFDVSLLKSPTFIIYGASCLLCMLGFFVPFIYLPTLCIDLGISATKAAFLISIIGIANTISRVVVGFVSDQPWADCLIINNVALIVAGVSTCFVPFLEAYSLFAAYTFIFGTSIAIFVSLRSIIMVELMGLEKLTNAFGLVIMCQGISSFVGAPIAGVLSDITGDYNISFYVAGICLGLSGLICFPLRRISQWEIARDRRRLEEKLSGVLAKNKSS